MKSEPSAKNHYNLGVAYHKEQSYNRALYSYIRSYRVADKIRPLVLFQIARIFIKQKKLNRAKKALARVNLEQVPSRLKQKIMSLREELFLKEVGDSAATQPDQKNEQNESDEVFSFYIDHSVGANNNPQALTGSSEDGPQVDLQNQIVSFLRYQLRKDFEVSLFNSHQFFEEQTEVNNSLNLLSAGYHVWSGKTWSFRMSPGYSLDTYAGKLFSQNWLVSAELNRAGKNTLWQNNVTYQNYAPENDDFSYLQGYSLSGSSQWQKQVGASGWLLGLGLDQFIYDDLDSFRSSYESLNLSAGYNFALSAWTLSLQSYFQFKNYQRGAEETTDRADVFSQSTLQIGYRLNKRFEIFQRNIFIHNDSSYEEDGDSRSYQQWQYLLGLSYQ